MVLDYNRIFKDIKEFLIYNGVKDEELFRNEFKKRRIYRRQNRELWPGNVGFNYIFIKGKNLKGTVRLMIEQGVSDKVSEISESLETILNHGDLKNLSKISIPKLDMLFNKHTTELGIDYHSDDRTLNISFDKSAGLFEMAYHINGRVNSLNLSML